MVAGPGCPRTQSCPATATEREWGVSLRTVRTKANTSEIHGPRTRDWLASGWTLLHYSGATRNVEVRGTSLSESRVTWCCSTCWNPHRRATCAERSSPPAGAYWSAVPPCAAWLTVDAGGRLSPLPAGPNHPWPQRLSITCRTEPVDYIRTQPTLVVEIRAEIATDHGRWRHVLRFLRIRAELRPEDLPTLPANGVES